MKDIERVFISDIHMSSAAAVTPAPGKHAYGWLSPDRAKRLGGFLGSATVAECQQLFLVGDVIDLWICPHDARPPTVLDVIDAPHNRPIVDGIQAFAAKPGRTVIWVKGNHDAEANADAAHHLAPNVSFVPHYDEFPLRVRHGHENCLFNAPDPTGREFPLGYFISRFVATAAARGMAEVGMNFRTIWKSGPELVALLEHGALVDCVFDVVRNAAGIKLEDRVIMPNGSTVEVSDVRATYQNLIAEWNQHKGNAMEAVLCEWDPFYDLPVNKPYLNINGHSHDHKYSSLITGGVYTNLGSWCAGDAHFAKTWLENAGQVNETLRAELFKWEPGVGAQSASTRASILTGGR